MKIFSFSGQARTAKGRKGCEGQTGNSVEWRFCRQERTKLEKEKRNSGKWTKSLTEEIICQNKYLSLTIYKLLDWYVNRKLFVYILHLNFESFWYQSLLFIRKFPKYSLKICKDMKNFFLNLFSRNVSALMEIKVYEQNSFRMT